jgi:tetratricopeptide (TPR) repeat protein
MSVIKMTNVARLASVALALVFAAAAAAEPAGPPEAPQAGAEPAGVKPPDLVRSLMAARPPLVQRENPFHIEIPELRESGADIAAILLEVYDPDERRWKGYGLMALRSVLVEGAQVRRISASIDFHAPAEGVYCLRAVARDRAGNLEQKPADLSDIQQIVVLDRNAPKVRLVSPAPEGPPLHAGDTLVIKWEAEESYPTREVRETRPGGGKKPVFNRAHVVEVSYDNGLTWTKVADADESGQVEWKIEGPRTDRFLVRVVVRDAAGNYGTATLARALALEAPVISKGVEAGARRSYQRGVTYMTRGDLEPAVGEFAEAIRLDDRLAVAYVDLSATYLRLYDRDRAFGARYLDLAERLAADGLKLHPKEIPLWYNLAQAQHRAGKPDSAARSLEAALAVDPRHVESLYLLALIRAGQNDLEAAKRLWRQVAALGGRESRLARQAVLCLSEAEQARPRPAARVQ